MDENKKDLELEAAEDTTEAIEEATEACEEVSEEIEEVSELEEAVEEDSTEAEKYVSVTALIDQINSLKKKKLVWKIIAIVLIAVVIIGGIFSLVGAVMDYNPYNHMGYPNISGLTVGSMTKFYGITMDEIIEEYSLPEDVREDTYYDVVQYLAPTSLILEMNGLDFETAKEVLKFSESVTPETPWGVAEDSMPLSVIVGEDEDSIQEFIEQYSLKGNITGETLWGTVRRKVLLKDYKDSIAPVEEVEEEILNEDNIVENELTEEELAEIMAYLETSTAPLE